MFRKLMAMETEAIRRRFREEATEQDPSDASLLLVAGGLARCTPSLPQRFGVCAWHFDG